MRLTRILTGVCVLAVAAGCSSGPAAPAASSAPAGKDQEYVKVVRSYAPGGMSDTDLLAAGAEACTALRQGKSRIQIQQTLTKKGFTQTDWALIFIIAEKCPELGNLGGPVTVMPTK